MSILQQTYRLAPFVSCCAIGGRHVFLDRQADRYYALRPSEDAAMARLVHGPIDDDHDTGGLNRLVACGLLVEAEEGRGLQLCSTKVPREAARPGFRRGGAIAQLNFAWKVAAARRRLRRRGLLAALAHIGDATPMPAETPPNHADLVQTGADLYGEITLFTTRHEECLPISLGLVEYLSGRGLPCDLVIGVQLGPFKAHAWVQHGDLLIGDDPDFVRTYTPILRL